jgi:type I restriction enzyme S subunit
VLPLPPLHEQEVIGSFLKSETKIANNAISRFECEISLLREYRTRLVSDVVTGKLDVRKAAKDLPEEVKKGETKDLSEESDRSDVSDFSTLVGNQKDVSDGDFETIAEEEI